MIIAVLYLMGGGILLYIGAESLVWGGTRFALRMKVSPIVIGLTVIAFGTSLPEFSVSLYSVIKDVQDIAVGNIIGSNIANVALILASSAIIFPVLADYDKLHKEILIVIGITLFFVLLAVDGKLSRLDGIVLVLGVAVYITRLVRRPLVEQELPKDERQYPLIIYHLSMIGGLISLLAGSQLFINGAVIVATLYNIPKLVIGSTIVAIGTSLPELATSIVAAMRKHSDIVLGNILGSNVFNLMIVLGVIPILQPLSISRLVVFAYLPLMLGLTAVLWPLVKVQNGIPRTAGLLLFSIYCVFIYFAYQM